MPMDPGRNRAAFSPAVVFGVILCALVALAAGALRIRGAFSDLILDEIWSLNHVRRLSSPLGILTSIHHDNNHYLNSLWMYCTGFRGNWPGYRLPSVVAGIATVGMAGLIGWRRNLANAWIAMLLVGFSYVLILYADEARGYSCAVFFSFLSYYFLDRYLSSPQKWIHALLFSISATAGLLSHLTFSAFLLAAFLWSALRLFRLGLPLKRIVAGLLLCHVLPGTVLAALYFVDVRHIKIGGGASTTLWLAYSTSLAWILPPASQGSITLITFLLVASALLCACWRVWRSEPDSAVFFATVILAAPLLVLGLGNSPVIYTRYFIIGTSFSLLLLSVPLASLYLHGWKGRLACLLILAGYCFSNARDTIILLRDGQGRYPEAVKYMMQRSREPVITVGSNQDFAIATVLAFYAKQLMGQRDLIYYQLGGWPSDGPEWVIRQQEAFGEPARDVPEIADNLGNYYLLEKTIPSAPLSSVHWFLYHNERRPPPSF